MGNMDEALLAEWIEKLRNAEFSPGDRVKKKRGSSWHGHVCGFYITPLTPIGYAVESEREKESVQIYPEGALEAAKDDEMWELPFNDREWFTLPMTLRERWWKETGSSKNPPSADLVEVIKAALSAKKED
jgi:hypothetical protein